MKHDLALMSRCCRSLECGSAVQHDAYDGGDDQRNRAFCKHHEVDAPRLAAILAKHGVIESALRCSAVQIAAE